MVKDAKNINKNEISEESLEQVTGGKVNVVGKPSEYDTPDEVVFTFAGYTFVRVVGLMKRTKILSYEAAIDNRSGKYGARYFCRDNGGKEEYFWDDELSFTIL